MRKFLRDILTTQEKGFTKYSQGRVYLFISFIAFFVTNLLLLYYTFTGVEIQDKDSLIIFSSNLKWALGSFALYVLGGKGIGAYRDSQTGIENNYMHEAEYSYWGSRPPGGGYGGYGHQSNYSQHPSNQYRKKSQANEPIETDVQNGFYKTGDEEVD